MDVVCCSTLKLFLCSSWSGLAFLRFSCIFLVAILCIGILQLLGGVTLELREQARFCYASMVGNPDQNSRVELTSLTFYSLELVMERNYSCLLMMSGQNQTQGTSESDNRACILSKFECTGLFRS